jgi:hypothetical protein
MLGDVIVLMKALRPSRGPSRRIPTRMYVAESIQAWNAAGAVRDFITGCWPRVWCADCWTELTAFSDDLR